MAVMPHAQLRYAPTHEPHPLLYPLHLVLAGVFAFVLPFICWAALATPGHPHGLPHFVFFDPVSADDSHAIEQAASHGASLHHVANAHAAPAPEALGDAAEKPTAQSVAPVLGVALLAPILLALAALPGDFRIRPMRREGERRYLSPNLPPTAPPPRPLLTPAS